MRLNCYNHRADLARRIQAAGIPIATENDGPGMTASLNDGLLVYVDGGETDTVAFDWYGGSAFIVNLVITVNVARFAISAFGLELPWTSEVQWLGDPSQNDNIESSYRFSKTLVFDRSQVLNHRADVRRIHPGGSSIVGCLLGTASAPIPSDFRHGSTVPAFLVVFDQWGRAYRSPISLWADRSNTLRPPRPKSKRKKLLDCPDAKPTRRQLALMRSRQGAI